MPEYIYVLGSDGKPQMPTKRRRHVQRLLDTGKARIAEHVPFTIQLLYKNEPVLQPVVMAEDPGRTNIGAAVVGLQGACYLLAVLETRNKEIRKRMEERRAYRRASRNGEWKARQRRAKRFHTMLKAGMVMRKLPQYGEDGWITCKSIRNTEARFCNRKRPKGWVTPTVEHLIRTHINLVHKMQKFLPITDVAMEINRFAFLLLDNPTVAGVDFQNGPLKGYRSVKDAVFEMQDGVCPICGKPIAQYHHIRPRSMGGSDTLANIIGLCEDCHENVHKTEKIQKQVQAKKAGLMKKYAALSALNQAIPFIYQRLVEEFGEGHVFYCTGRETSMVRRSLGFTKTREEPLHEVDAYCIALQALRLPCKKLPAFAHVYQMKQFRRQDRAVTNHMRERTYFSDGKAVAKNRAARFEQKGDSLTTWYQKMIQQYGIKQAEAMRSRLTVRKSTRYYNTPGRLMPGAVFYYQGERLVMSGQFSYGRYLKAVGDGKTNYPAAKCRIVQQNAGIVFIR